MGWRPGHAFDPGIDRRARRFALRAIAAQPGDYAATVRRGPRLTGDWNRHAYPSPWTAGLYRFSRRPVGVPDAPVAGGGTATSVVQAYFGSSRAIGTRVTEPYAGLLRGYQTWAFLRGPMLALILAVGLAGLVRRRPGGALPWTMAVFLLTVPLLTTDFDYRYLLPAGAGPPFHDRVRPRRLDRSPGRLSRAMRAACVPKESRTTPARHHRCFACALTVAVVLRVLATAAYFPALGFNDSFALVTAVQHLMGLAPVPVLFDAREIELEQLVMSDVFFMSLTTCALTVVLWRPVVTWRAGASPDTPP